MKSIGLAFLALMLAITGPFSEASAAERQSAQSGAQRIIGGTFAPAGAWPFMVGLVYKAEPSTYAAHFCGGSLIRPNYVLTAAHCVRDLARTDLQVLVGTRSLVSGGRRVDVAKIIIHPRYEPETFDNDIALIKLTQPVTGLPRAVVAGLGQEQRYAAPLTTATVIGWGDTDASFEVSYPTLLRQAKVKLRSQAACNAPNAYAGDVTPRMLCAGTFAGGKDTCQGDSGGPLVVPDSAGRVRVQVGIVSWGKACAAVNAPGVYTRVALFQPWILGKIAASP